MTVSKTIPEEMNKLKECAEIITNVSGYREVERRSLRSESGNNAVEGCIEYYSPLDNNNRTGSAYAIICQKTVKQGKHRKKNNAKPSGWKSIPDKSIPGGYLYNRCHLIGCQLIEKLYKKGTPGVPNCNVRKVITGTRYLNESMLIFENMVVDYLKMHPDIHVFYRAIPEYREDCLLAERVLIEAMSIEDGGNSLWFRGYCFNEQPGIKIDYKTGEILDSNRDSENCTGI